jgi:DNA-binding NarL/FixJ family response regulator
MTNPIRVLLVDDHPPFRIGMRVLLEQSPAIQVVGEADNGKAALDQIDALQPDVVVLDCQLPDLDGPTVAAEIRRRELPVRLLALSAYDDLKYIRGLLAAGAVGYLLKNEAPETIVAAVQAAANGHAYFSASVAAKLAALAQPNNPMVERPTPREREVLHELARGLTNGEIAHKLTISERTVRFHIENLFGRLQVENRVEVVMKAIQLGWVEPPGKP